MDAKPLGSSAIAPSANATLYYETETWVARISEAYRGKYLDSAGGNGKFLRNMSLLTTVAAETQYRARS
jgi:hypothetical protein